MKYDTDDIVIEIIDVTDKVAEEKKRQTQELARQEQLRQAEKAAAEKALKKAPKKPLEIDLSDDEEKEKASLRERLTGRLRVPETLREPKKEEKKAEARVRQEKPVRQERPVKAEAPVKQEVPAKPETSVKKEAPVKQEAPVKPENAEELSGTRVAAAVDLEKEVQSMPAAAPALEENSIPSAAAEPIPASERTKRPVHITESGRLPLSLAIETDGGLVSRIAEIGDVLPVTCTREFSTGNASIKAVALNLYAGERPVAAQNKKIGQFKITGIEQLPAGRPVITVRFEIDRDGTIHIDALDEGSLRRCSKVIDSSWKPSEEEIYAIVQEAQNNLTEDNKVRERSRLLRNARECLFRADSMLRTRKKELSGEERRAIKDKSKRLRQRMKKVNVLDMTELNEKAVADAVNSLDNALRSK